MPVVPMTRDHVGDDRRRRLDPAGAGALERDLADRVSLQHDRVERALDRGERVVPVDEGGPDAHVELPVHERCALPTSRTTISSSRAAAMSSSEIASMPSYATSSSSTREPNATVARIAIFAAASRPLTSSVGSASAKPSRCASASASP